MKTRGKVERGAGPQKNGKGSNNAYRTRAAEKQEEKGERRNLQVQRHEQLYRNESESA